MKTLFRLLIFALLMTACNSQPAQNQPFEVRMQNNTEHFQRYKMMPTDNIHILLKYDTRTGAVWLVQYGLSDTPATEIKITGSERIYENEGWNGRFELYPTKNMYNFIMIDTCYGTTYQVQWNTDEQYRFVQPISQL